MNTQPKIISRSLTRLIRNGSEHAWLYIDTYADDTHMLRLVFNGKFNPWLDIKECSIPGIHPPKLVALYEKFIDKLTERGFVFDACDKLKVRESC